jgi:hypothetical protein
VPALTTHSPARCRDAIALNEKKAKKAAEKAAENAQ